MCIPLELQFEVAGGSVSTEDTLSKCCFHTYIGLFYSRETKHSLGLLLAEVIKFIPIQKPPPICILLCKLQSEKGDHLVLIDGSSFVLDALIIFIYFFHIKNRLLIFISYGCVCWFLICDFWDEIEIKGRIWYGIKIRLMTNDAFFTFKKYLLTH